MFGYVRFFVRALTFSLVSYYMTHSPQFYKNLYFGHLIQIFIKLLSHVRLCTFAV